MKPVEFDGMTKEFAKTQDEYVTLPAHVSPDGIVTSCWRLTFLERIRVLFSGDIFIQTMTFNKPLQPQKLTAKTPLTPIARQE